jgi:hypothetical protein
MASRRVDSMANVDAYCDRRGCHQIPLDTGALTLSPQREP